MSGITGSQADYILSIANGLMGTDYRVLDQLKQVGIYQPRGGFAKAEASALIDELLAEKKADDARLDAGLSPGARVSFTYTWRDGRVSEESGVVKGWKTGGFKVIGLRIEGAANWFAMERVQGLATA